MVSSLAPQPSYVVFCLYCKDVRAMCVFERKIMSHIDLRQRYVLFVFELCCDPVGQHRGGIVVEGAAQKEKGAASDRRNPLRCNAEERT